MLHNQCCLHNGWHIRSPIEEQECSYWYRLWHFTMWCQGNTLLLMLAKHKMDSYGEIVWPFLLPNFSLSKIQICKIGLVGPNTMFWWLSNQWHELLEQLLSHSKWIMKSSCYTVNTKVNISRALHKESDSSNELFR
jgi:hypothetical protein